MHRARRERAYTTSEAARSTPTVSAQKSAIDETARAVLDRKRRARVAAEACARGDRRRSSASPVGARNDLVYDHTTPRRIRSTNEDPPFERPSEDGYLFARGVSANKGNSWRASRRRAYRATIGDLRFGLRVYSRARRIGGELAESSAERDRLRADADLEPVQDARGRPRSLAARGSRLRAARRARKGRAFVGWRISRCSVALCGAREPEERQDES